MSGQSDVIGRGVIEVVGDSTKLKATLAESSRDVVNFGKTTQNENAKSARSIDAYIRKLELSTQTLGKSAREAKLFELAQRGASEAQLKAADAALRTIEAYKQQQAKLGAVASTQNTVADSAKALGYQHQIAAVQVKDFIEQMISGASPVRAFAQQGTAVVSTYGGVGATFRSIGSLLTPLRLGLGLAAAGVGALALAFLEGHLESRAFADAMTISGNFAGQTEGQFRSMARTVASATQTTVSNVREIGLELIKTGEIGPASFSSATAAAIAYARATGKSAADVARDFADMTRAPSKFALEANRSLNFITVAQYAAIRSFEQNGRAADAQGVIYDALNARFPKLNDNLGLIDRALQKGKNAWASFWDAALDIGRTETVEEKLDRVNQKIEERRQRGPLNSLTAGAFERGNARLDAERNALARRSLREGDNAFSEADRSATEKRRIAAFEAVEGYKAQAKGLDLVNEKLAEAKRNFAALAGTQQAVSPADQARILRDIKKRFQNTDDEEERKAKLQRDLDQIRNASQAQVNTLSNAERIMAATRAAGLLDESEYYDAKRAFLALNAKEEERALQQQIDRIRKEKASGKERVDNERRIADLEARLREVRESAAAGLEVLNIEEVAGLRAVAQAYRDAEAAAQDYLDGIRRTQSRDLGGIGLGNRERERLAGRAPIEDRFNDQRRNLERGRRDAELNGTFGPEAQRKYDEELERIKRFEEQALMSYDEYVARRLEAEGHWQNGATEALRNYLDEATQVAKQTEDLFSRAFHGAEDALVKFITTGKLDFKSLANSVVADITRIIVKQQLANALTSLMGKGGGESGGFTNTVGSFIGSLLGGGRAIGGPVSAGSIHPVNERRPELLEVAGTQYLMMGSQDGMVKQMPAGEGGRQVSLVLNVQAQPGMTRQTALQQGEAMGRAAQLALSRNA
jgi:lambda family phage tail tape measure protein